MAIKKSGLGRGLGSLFEDTSLVQKAVPVEPKKAEPEKKVEKITGNKKEEVKVSSDSIQYIKLNDIKPNSAQPRKIFDEEALADLADSIKENGVIQPIMVRPSGKGYELVAGERRWRAARIAGLKEIPAIIRELDEQTNALYALIENMQREDLNAIEEAEGIRFIMDKYSFNQEETAKVIGKSRPYISNALRLLDLPEFVKEMLSLGKLTVGHAKAIAGLAGEDVQKEVAEKAVSEGWSVRQIESYTKAKPKKTVITKKKNKKDEDTKALEEKLAEALGTKVEIEGSPKKGKILISYFSQDELERIIELLG